MIAVSPQGWVRGQVSHSILPYLPYAVGAVVLFIMGLLGVSPSMADGGPHSQAGLYATTDVCANCHRAHTGQGSRLIAEPTQWTLCTTCHDGSGADTDIVDGVYIPSSAGLKGGGFANALMDPGVTAVPGSAAVTSTHVVDGTSATAWGGGAISGTPAYGTAVTLECGNCHNPHGNGQYRVLRRTPNEGYGTTDVIVADEGTKDYDISYLSTGYRDTSYAPSSIADWCAQCHTRYLAGLGSGSTDSGDAVYRFRHVTQGLSGGCLKCHLAHGTSATMATYSGAVLRPDGSAGGGASDSRLLHVNSRGVCTQCHASGGGFVGGCTACHGQPPAAGSHDSHFTATYGPNISSCDTCHTPVDGTHMNGQVDFADGVAGLSSTAVCNPCHSPGGSYDGVNDGAIGAKVNWSSGVYTGGDLVSGKEKWCAGCHDESPSVVKGVSAPEVIGDETASTSYGTGYGYYKTGHGLPTGLAYPASGRQGAGLECLSCHDATAGHTDGDPRTYLATSDNYQAGYRLKSVSGGVPLDIPLSGSGVSGADYALCFQCHTETNYVVQNDFTTEFRKQTNKNLHYFHLNKGGQEWNSDWTNGSDDSRISCPACHNVHGSQTPAMVRHGELISTPGTTDAVPALDFQYQPVGTYPLLSNSTGGVCAQFCHGQKSYDRTP